MINVFIELNLSQNGYDGGFVKDEFDCNLDKCECLHFNQTVIGKTPFEKFFQKENHLGDVAVSEKTLTKMMETSDDEGLLRAFPDAGADFWDQNFVNDVYVIAYEFNSGLHKKVQSMLPKVYLRIQTRIPFYHDS